MQSYISHLDPGKVYAVAHHLYNFDTALTNSDLQISDLTSFAQAMTTYSQSTPASIPPPLRFQTEYFTTNAFNTAWTIYNDIVYGGDNAYFYWCLSWFDNTGLLYVDNANDPQSNWASPHGWFYNDAYFAVKQFSYFVRPGYRLYPLAVTNSDERVAAFQSPDQKTTVLVILNTSSVSTDTLALDLSSLNIVSSAVYRSTFTGNREYWNSIGGLPTGNTVDLPPQSVATIVLTTR